MSYCAYITRITNLRKHSNADRLQVGECFGNFIIVDLKTNEGDLGVYFPTDGKLGLEYATENNLLRKKDENGKDIGGYLDVDKRNIRSLKLRGEKSDGLFMPLSSLEKFCDIKTLKEGDVITVLNGTTICEKYIPVKKHANVTSNKKGKKKVAKSVSYPFFEEHIDTSQLAYNKHQFKANDTCYITLKMHGTSARTSYAMKQETKKILFFKKVKNTWEYVSGSRRVVLKNFEKGGYYDDNSFRKVWHDYFKGKLRKGETVYYEIVGYINENTTIMPECDNKKINDKEFSKLYGEKTRFTYGCSVGQNNIYVYRMTMTNEDGDIVEYPWELVKVRCEQMAVNCVPEFDKFIFTDIDDLNKRVDEFVDGVDPVGKTHVKEGVVVRIDNRQKFTAFKHKSWNFKVLESIIKDEGILDMEEGESIINEES